MTSASGLVPPDPEDAPAHEQRQRLGARSLTARLIVGVVGLVLVLVLVIGASTYYALKVFLYDRLDQQLDTTASESLRQLFQPETAPDPALHNPQHVYAVALATNGQLEVYPQYGDVHRLPLNDEDRHRLVHVAEGTRMTVQTTVGQLRVERTGTILVTPATAPPGTPPTPLITVIGLSTDDEHNTLDQLLRDELLIGGVAVVIAFLATSYGVRFSLRNLRRVTSTANEIAAELSPTGTGLERRVDVPDDGSEVGQLAESMNTLLSAVETQFAARLESETRLRQFLADASHELRTPLTSIRGYAELARMQRTAGTDAEDNLSRIESEGTRMSRLVEDLLMLARGDQLSPPRTELIEVSELLDDVVASARAAFPDRRIDTQLAPGLHVVGDPDQLYRVVRNLIGNADMHTAPGGPVLVRSGPDEQSVLIQVIDSGPGLPPDEAARVFERFWRADKARSRAHGGTGLGLSIVAAIVMAHRGSVYFDSSVEHGSTVTVRLPAAFG